ncbi:unnamed protein product, partial [Linum tenue]
DTRGYDPFICKQRYVFQLLTAIQIELRCVFLRKCKNVALVTEQESTTFSRYPKTHNREKLKSQYH